MATTYQTRTKAITAEHVALDDLARISRALGIVAKFYKVLGAYPNAARRLDELADILTALRETAIERQQQANEDI